MSLFKRVLGIAAFAAVVLAMTACERKITRVEVVQEPQSCFSCHSDTNTVLVSAQGQWQNSKHASGGTLNENDSTCKGCHTSQGFIARITGVTISDAVENPTAIHCFTCHAPHTNGNFKLRVTAPVTLQDGTTYDLHEGNLCATCHQSRRNVKTYVTARTTLSTRWGPHHGPQGDMLIGTNGYEYTGFTYERTNHRSATANGCIDCHMKTTSQNVVGGHSVNMSYDLDGTEVLNTDACVACHGAITDFSQVGDGFSVQDSVQTLINTLSDRLTTAGLIAGGLPKAVTTSADSAGAVWNFLVVSEDRSLGVHNAKYIMGLLRSSIQHMSGTVPSTNALASRPVTRQRIRR